MKTIGNIIYVLAGLLLLFSLVSCNDKDSFGSGTLTFENTTLSLDTCFSTVPTPHKTLMSQGAQVTLILVADLYSPANVINPSAAPGLGAHTYYALNGTTAEGCETLAALGSYLANRYS